MLAETEVTAVRPRNGGGYHFETSPSFNSGAPQSFSTDRAILAGGVLGTVPLLLRMKEEPEGLPVLSPLVGQCVRSNSEALFNIVSPRRDQDLSKGIAITSILHADEHSHIEPVRYGPGSGFFRTLLVPHSPGSTVLRRLAGAFGKLLRHPIRWLRALTVGDFARRSQILLYMRTLEGTLSLKLARGWRNGFRRAVASDVDDPSQAPSAFMPEATDLANRFADQVDGVPTTLLTETVLGVPSTAHILGGAPMGASPQTGVINSEHEVFNYPGLYVIDGSAISANPGVNPALTITALAERAMALIPAKGG